jgi:MscS family membrane protein
LRSILYKAFRALDLSKISAAARKQEGIDSIGLLYDILLKIEPPPEKTIPGAEAFADDTAKTPAYWKIPHTEITIARIEEGPRTGEFLFTSEPVEHLEEFYERVRDRPVRRKVALENIYKLRQVIGGWMIPPWVIDRLPGWLMILIFGQALWKQFSLTILTILVLATLLPIFLWAHRGSQERSFGFLFAPSGGAIEYRCDRAPRPISGRRTNQFDGCL